MKKALITGITGQDGSYLAEFLLKKGYQVYGIVRRSSSINTARLDPIYEAPQVKNRKLNLIYGDLNDASSINRILRTVKPDEIYNLAAQSHVKVSFEIPEYNLHREFITAENINSLFGKYHAPTDFDLLAIDIDYNDFYVWNNTWIRRQP